MDRKNATNLPQPNEMIDVRKETMNLVQKFYRESLGDIDLTLMIEALISKIRTETEAVVTKRVREGIVQYLRSHEFKGIDQTITEIRNLYTYESNDAGELNHE